MNVGIHPGHWFHHLHVEEHTGHGKLYQTLHNQTFWGFTILTALFVGAVVLIVVLGKNPQSNFPYEPMYFP